MTFREKIKYAIPSAVTTIGLVLCLYGIWFRNPWCLLSSLGCDILDGYLARRLDTNTYFGKVFDYLTDVSLCLLMLVVCLGHVTLFVLPVLIPIQAWCLTSSYHFSGRAAVAIFMCAQIWGWV